jgi:hypothetical protein
VRRHVLFTAKLINCGRRKHYDLEKTVKNGRMLGELRTPFPEYVIHRG